MKPHDFEHWALGNGGASGKVMISRVNGGFAGADPGASAVNAFPLGS